MPKKDDIEIPSLTLDKDEVSHRKTSEGASSNASKRHLNPPPAKPIGGNSGVYKKPSFVGIYILLILILGAASGAGYWLWQQNDQLRSELSGAKDKIDSLDHQLLASDVSASKKGQSLEDRIKDNENEVRKLWAVAYDRNRKNISDNGDVINAASKKLDVLKDIVSTQGKRVAMQSDDFTKLDNSYNKLIKSVADLEKEVKPLASDASSTKSEVSGLSSKLSKLEKKTAAQSDSNDALSLSIDQVTQDLNNLKKKIASGSDLGKIKQELEQHQNAIDSSDAFRAQVNSQLLRIRKQVNQIMLQQQMDSNSK